MESNILDQFESSGYLDCPRIMCAERASADALVPRLAGARIFQDPRLLEKECLEEMGFRGNTLGDPFCFSANNVSVSQTHSQPRLVGREDEGRLGRGTCLSREGHSVARVAGPLIIP